MASNLKLARFFPDWHSDVLELIARRAAGSIPVGRRLTEEDYQRARHRSPARRPRPGKYAEQAARFRTEPQRTIQAMTNGERTIWARRGYPTEGKIWERIAAPVRARLARRAELRAVP